MRAYHCGEFLKVELVVAVDVGGIKLHRVLSHAGVKGFFGLLRAGHIVLLGKLVRHRTSGRRPPPVGQVNSPAPLEIGRGELKR